MTVDSSWARITAWLGAQVPAMAAGFAPPATDDEVDAASREVGVAFPPDLRAWFGLVGGNEGQFGSLVPAYFDPLSVAASLADRKIWLEVGEDEEVGDVAGTEEFAWHPSWVPIAQDAGGTTLFVDLREGDAHGCVMEYDKVEACDGTVRWPSVAALLVEIADALDSGGEVSGYRATVGPDGLTWS
jgi:cell wall assembly regulator SMI1